MNDKIKAMATLKRAFVGGHMQTVILTDYQNDNDTYHGVAFRARKTGDEADVTMTAVHGLRPYPYVDRPNSSDQFVNAGEDEQPLIDIGNAGADHHREVIDAGKQDRIDQINNPEQVFDPADTDKSGDVSKAERKKWNKENPGEGK